MAKQIKYILIILMLVLVAVLIYKFNLKNSLIGVIKLNLGSKEAGILAGILLGDKNSIDKNLYDQLKITGLVHMVVASGTNVMLLTTAAIEQTAGWLGRKTAIVGGGGLMWFYALMIGMDAPIVRAALLLSLVYLAQLVGRKYDIARGLALTVVIMLAADYRVVTSVSFWLSMMAFGAIVTKPNLVKDSSTSPPVGGFAQNDKLRFFLKSVAAGLWQTMWVMVWITPIMGLVFGKISLLTPIWNMMILFLVEAISVVGGVGMLLGAMVPILGKVLWLVAPMLTYVVKVVEWGSTVGGVIEIKFNWLVVIGWYLILISFLVKNK